MGQASKLFKQRRIAIARLPLSAGTKIRAKDVRPGMFFHRFDDSNHEFAFFEVTRVEADALGVTARIYTPRLRSDIHWQSVCYCCDSDTEVVVYDDDRVDAGS